VGVGAVVAEGHGAAEGMMQGAVRGLAAPLKPSDGAA